MGKKPLLALAASAAIAALVMGITSRPQADPGAPEAVAPTRSAPVRPLTLGDGHAPVGARWTKSPSVDDASRP